METAYFPHYLVLRKPDTVQKLRQAKSSSFPHYLVLRKPWELGTAGELDKAFLSTLFSSTETYYPASYRLSAPGRLSTLFSSTETSKTSNRQIGIAFFPHYLVLRKPSLLPCLLWEEFPFPHYLVLRKRRGDGLYIVRPGDFPHYLVLRKHVWVIPVRDEATGFPHYLVLRKQNASMAWSTLTVFFPHYLVLRKHCYVDALTHSHAQYLSTLFSSTETG